jgi:hypothetical protein
MANSKIQIVLHLPRHGGAGFLSELLTRDTSPAGTLAPALRKGISNGKWQIAKFKLFYICPATAGLAF